MFLRCRQPERGSIRNGHRFLLHFGVSDLSLFLKMSGNILQNPFAADVSRKDKLFFTVIAIVFNRDLISKKIYKISNFN